MKIKHVMALNNNRVQPKRMVVGASGDSNRRGSERIT